MFYAAKKVSSAINLTVIATLLLVFNLTVTVGCKEKKSPQSSQEKTEVKGDLPGKNSYYPEIGNEMEKKEDNTAVTERSESSKSRSNEIKIEWIEDNIKLFGIKTKSHKCDIAGRKSSRPERVITFDEHESGMVTIDDQVPHYGKKRIFEYFIEPTDDYRTLARIIAGKDEECYDIANHGSNRWALRTCPGRVTCETELEIDEKSEGFRYLRRKGQIMVSSELGNMQVFSDPIQFKHLEIFENILMVTDMKRSAMGIHIKSIFFKDGSQCAGQGCVPHSKFADRAYQKNQGVSSFWSFKKPFKKVNLIYSFHGNSGLETTDIEVSGGPDCHKIARSRLLGSELFKNKKNADKVKINGGFIVFLGHVNLHDKEVGVSCIGSDL